MVGTWTTWWQAPALPLTLCADLGKSLSSLGLSSPICKIEVIIIIIIIIIVIVSQGYYIKEIVHVKNLIQKQK